MTSLRSVAPTRLAVLAGLLYLPFVGLGYGTDIDITNLRRSGESLLAGEYHYSRPPGALPYEALVGVLDRVGGAVAVNLASVAAAVLVLWTVADLVTRAGSPRAGRIAVIVIATQPWFWIAATSLGDYLFALALLLVGVRAVRDQQTVRAGFALGTAIGFRSGSVVLVGALLVARLLTRVDDRRTLLVRTATVGALAAAVAVAWFVPPWLSVGGTTRFLENEFETAGTLVTIARWGVKNVAFFGVLTLVVLLVRAPVLAAPLRSFRDDFLVRFSVLAAIAAELLFLRFPWKPLHLLPVLVCGAILLALGHRTSDTLVATVVATHLVLAMVSVTLAEPDVADAATTGEIHIGLTRGVVVNDVDCRTDAAFSDWPDLDDPAADVAADEVFDCQARSWRAGAG